jgi:putative sigma-54 modulation protein
VIKKLEISGVHSDTTKDIKNYVKEKIGKLDKYLPAHAQKSAHAEVRLIESKVKNKNDYTSEVTLFLPGETLSAKATTQNMNAAIDIVEEKLKAQLRRYKQRNIAKDPKRVQKIRQVLGKIVRRRR